MSVGGFGIAARRLLPYIAGRISLWKILVWLVLTLFGYACAILSAHGPDILTFLGLVLLLPNYVLAHISRQLSVFYELSFVNVVIFFFLQFAYFRVIEPAQFTPPEPMVPRAERRPV